MSKRIAELEADKKILINVVKDKSDFHTTKDAMRIAELEAQMPEEGEWIVEEIDDSGFKWCKWSCSVCREVVKKGWQHTKDGEKPRWKYCPNCGARMKEKQKTESKNIKSSLEYDYCGTPKRRYDIEARDRRANDE
jgi:rubrerythrin